MNRKTSRCMIVLLMYCMSSDDGLFRKNGLENPEIVSSQNQGDLFFLISVANQPLDQLRHIFNLLEVLNVDALVQWMVLIFESARAIVLDEIQSQRQMLNSHQLHHVVEMLE